MTGFKAWVFIVSIGDAGVGLRGTASDERRCVRGFECNRMESEQVGLVRGWAWRKKESRVGKFVSGGGSCKEAEALHRRRCLMQRRMKSSVKEGDN